MGLPQGIFVSASSHFKSLIHAPSQADTCRLTMRLLRLTSYKSQQWCHSPNGYILSGNSFDSCSSNRFNVICNARRRMLLKADIHWTSIKPSKIRTPKSYVAAASTLIAVHLERNLPLQVNSISRESISVVYALHQ